VRINSSESRRQRNARKSYKRRATLGTMSCTYSGV